MQQHIPWDTDIWTQSLAGAPSCWPWLSKHVECHAGRLSSLQLLGQGVPIGWAIGPAQAGAAGLPRPDPALCSDGGAEPWPRPVPPQAAVLGGIHRPSSSGLCCEGSTLVPGEMALAAMGGTWEHGVAQWSWLWHVAMMAQRATCNWWSWCDHTMPSHHGHMPYLCVALPWAWSCSTHPGPYGLPLPCSPSPSSTLIFLQEHPLPGHGQGQAVTPQRPCLSMSPREAHPAAPSTAHRLWAQWPSRGARCLKPCAALCH